MTDFKDIYYNTFPRYPYTFDEPPRRVIEHAKDGVMKVNNMPLKQVISYLVNTTNIVSFFFYFSF